MTSAPPALRRAEFVGYASLLASAGTLVCCTIPALMVAVGAGAVLASAVTAFPALVWLSEYKIAVFAIAATMLALAGALQWRARRQPCPADPVQAVACERARRTAHVVYAISVAVFLVGGTFAFVLPLALRSQG